MRRKYKAGLDADFLISIVEYGEPAARLTLARQLVAFMCSDKTPTLERQQLKDVVLKLTVDPVKDVRVVLAQGLCKAFDLPGEVALSIAADSPEISLPFINICLCLSSETMIALLSKTDEVRQVAVAARPDISEQTVAYCVASASAEACITLLDNPEVKLDADAYRLLFARFPDQTELVRKLLLLPNLPLDVRILQTRHTCVRMRQLITERDWMPANDSAAVVEEAEETAILRILLDANEVERSEAIAFMVQQKILTSSLLVRAACLGDMLIVETALATLADIQTSRARNHLYGRTFGGFNALMLRTGLPKACQTLLRLAATVTTESQGEEIPLDQESFGRRLVEKLATAYNSVDAAERARLLEYISRYAHERVRIIARRIKAGLTHAA